MDTPQSPNPEPRGLQLIKPYFSHLYYITAGSVFDWIEAARAAPRIAIARTDRGQANLIYDFILLRVREAFGPLEGHELKIVEQYDSTLIQLDSGLQIKFNKLDDEKLVHPPKTKRAEGFYRQQYRMFGSADDVDGLTVVSGYRLAFGRMSLADVIAQCQSGEHLEWAYPIPEPPAGHQFSIQPRNIGPTSPLPGFTVGDKEEGRDDRKAE